MKTSHVPVMCMLAAAVTTLVLDIVQGMSISIILRDFLIALVCFFIIGKVVKVFLDRTFNPKEPEPEEEEKEDFPVDEEGGETAENEEEGSAPLSEAEVTDGEIPEDFQ